MSGVFHLFLGAFFPLRIGTVTSCVFFIFLAFATVYGTLCMLYYWRFLSMIWAFVMGSSPRRTGI